MKKIISVIPIAVLFILLSNKISVSAASINNEIGSYTTVLYVQDNNQKWYALISNYGVRISNNTIYFGDSGSGMGIFGPYSGFPNYTENVSFYSSDRFTNFTTVILVQLGYVGIISSDIPYFDSIEDYEDSLNTHTWWGSMWDELGEKLGDPNFWFGEWFINIIDNVFGNNEGGGPSQHSISTHVHIEDPTLTPAPTPIPYTTVVIPKTDPISGDTYYETNYYYNNPSGTPIVQPYPPTQPPATNSPSGGTEYIPINGDPYSIPVVSWLTSATIGDSNYDGIDSVGSGLNSIDEIGSEYTDGMSAVQDSTGTLPTSWILLIGVAAAIPLVAGLISRFLS